MEPYLFIITVEYSICMLALTACAVAAGGERSNGFYLSGMTNNYSLLVSHALSEMQTPHSFDEHV